jgi:hypothetical protein
MPNSTSEVSFGNTRSSAILQCIAMRGRKTAGDYKLEQNE